MAKKEKTKKETIDFDGAPEQPRQPEEEVAKEPMDETLPELAPLVLDEEEPVVEPKPKTKPKAKPAKKEVKPKNNRILNIERRIANAEARGDSDLVKRLTERKKRLLKL